MIMSKKNLSEMVRQEFDTHDVLKLSELYVIIFEKSDLDISEKKIQHRIRSRLNDMVRHGKIKRIAPETYTKILIKE